MEKVNRGDVREVRELERVEKETSAPEQKAAPEQKEVAAPEQKEAPVAESKAEATQQVAETKSDTVARTGDPCADDPDNFHHDDATGTCVAN